MNFQKESSSLNMDVMFLKHNRNYIQRNMKLR
jgi:hypothetical protein